jgi:hypothetical protein
MLSVFYFPEACLARLFVGTDSMTDFDFVEAPCDTPPLPLGYGASGDWGPAYTGHRDLEWIHAYDVRVREPEVFGMNVQAASGATWPVVELEGRTDFTYQTVSRFGKTLEVFTALAATGAGHIVAIEGRLSRRL